MTYAHSQSRRHALSASIALLFTVPGLVFADPPAQPLDAARAAASPRLAVPTPEPDTSGAALLNPFVQGKAVTPNAQSLSAPVTINANTSTDALTATQTGTGRALSGVINNANSTISALKGTTNGSGAALAGQNTGTAGSAAQFQISNTKSSQPATVTSTTGTGNAIQAIQGNTGSVDTPAILGQHVSGTKFYGVGVEGDGKYIGVKGVGYGNGYGVYGSSTDAAGVYGYSANNFGVYGTSSNSYAGYFAGTVYVTGTLTAQNFATTSDRNVKESIEPVDTESVLDRVAAMPISSWDFQSQPGIHHIGPMAQDFRKAFGLGADDKHIDLVDGVGVSLAAIQELQRRVTSKEARIESLEAQLQSLRLAVDARLAALENVPTAATSTAPLQP